MGKRLIIAEKPSVARDIATTLAVPTSGKGYFESNDLVISSALGHLFEIGLPAELAHAREKWSLSDLPLLPAAFELSPVTHAKQQLGTLLTLLKRSDITGVINACDAGREGELIFLYIMRYAHCVKPVERLWLQSMTSGAIKESFNKLRPGASMQPLADAAVCRAESDWLVGINGSRVLSLTELKRQVTPVGRVQTPTLALMVTRELEIRQFVPKDYWLVKATFQAKAGTYVGVWFDPNFKGEGRADRIWEQSKAERIKFACQGKTSTVIDQSKQVTKNCPALYDLTTLQREANRRLGFSAAKTLKIAQELYETYKVLTYPRTDARVLPDDYVPVAQATMMMLAGNYPKLGAHAMKAVASSWVKMDKRIFNSAKVTDHFAIIPTIKPPEQMPADEAALYNMVAQRFIAVFFPAAEYLETERISKVESALKEIHHFKSRGKITINPGWTVVYGADGQDDDEKEREDEQALPPVEGVERPPVIDIKVCAEKTKPPMRYTEASILSAMESAGRAVDDDELREAMAARGLGTPATRASIIEGLISSEYIERKKKELHPTEKAISLLARLKSLDLESLSSPQLTGEWEYKLHLMEQAKVHKSTFMQEIKNSVTSMVNKVKQAAPIIETSKDLNCPTCKKPLQIRGEAFSCSERHIYLNKLIAQRVMTLDEYKTLLATGSVGPLSGFVSKLGKPFSAKLKLGEKGVEFDFGPKEVPTESLTFGPWRVGVGDKFYAVEKKDVKFSISKVIAQRPILPNEVQALLIEGRTEILHQFISKAGKPFSAFLVLKKGKVEFEFEQRPKFDNKN